MARIDQETVQRILDAADIVDVVSDFVKLRRSGANYKGLCPFHNERTPSFSVNKARNICKCFSCGKGGSPVNFIMEHEQMSYQEALRYLARKYNIEIKERELSDEERAQQSKREALLAVNAFALKHFEHKNRKRASVLGEDAKYIHGVLSEDSFIIVLQFTPPMMMGLTMKTSSPRTLPPNQRTINSFASSKTCKT